MQRNEGQQDSTLAGNTTIRGASFPYPLIICIISRLQQWSKLGGCACQDLYRVMGGGQGGEGRVELSCSSEVPPWSSTDRPALWQVW